MYGSKTPDPRLDGDSEKKCTTLLSESLIRKSIHSRACSSPAPRGSGSASTSSADTQCSRR